MPANELSVRCPSLRDAMAYLSILAENEKKNGNLRMITNYICEDCTIVFQIYGKKRRKSYFCPVCGENTAVMPYEAERCSDSKAKVRWTEEELALIQECITGQIQPYQVAIRIGRSINAVVKKVKRMKVDN